MATTVPPATLAWAAFTVAGAGLVNLALGAGQVDQALWWGVGLSAVGLVELVWALLSLAAARPLAARAAPGALLLATSGWAVVVAQGLVPTGGGGTDAAPLTGADTAVVVLGLVGAATSALLQRAAAGPSPATPVGAPAEVADPRSRPTRPPRAAGTGRVLAGWAVGAAFAAAVATPGLAATDAGAAAVPHGTAVHGSTSGNPPEDAAAGDGGGAPATVPPTAAPAVGPGHGH